MHSDDFDRVPVRDADDSPLASVMSDSTFAHFRDFIQAESGIHLVDAKKLLLSRRLAPRMRQLGLRDFDSYWQWSVERRDPAEIEQLLNCITTKKTSFFRDARQFEFLAGLAREWSDAGALAAAPRVWSTACATGEEPYSIAMTLLAHYRASFELLATDVATDALAQARTGEWPIARAAEIPPDYLRRFMLRGVGDRAGRLKAGPELASAIQFARVNLSHARFPVAGRFDAIFCRNVLIYFDAEHKRRVVDRLIAHLRPEGYLFLGQAESLIGQTSRLRIVIPNVYRLVADGAR